jgi:tripartite-type tricarboxylate transporter receptor subunit TctC
MKLPRRTFLHLAAGTAALPAVSRIAMAQTYPSRPITIVVPFPAGGPTDALARILADRMKRALGQSVIVENPTGAAGTIGTGRVARATPDGYTVILGHWQTHVVNGATYTLPFDMVKDFEPISLVADCPVWFVAKAALPQKDLRELIAWMKENPGKATVGIGGVGGGADVVGTYFQKNTGTRFQFVPYRGAAPMIQDLVAGQIDLTFTQVASALAQVRSGQLKAYAVMAKTRWAATPDTPTIDEAGVPGLHASF